MFRDSAKVKPSSMHFKLIVSCPAHTGLMNRTLPGLLLPLASGSAGDVKQWEIEPGLAVVVAQKLPDGFCELVNSGASSHGTEAFASLLTPQKVSAFGTSFTTSHVGDSAGACLAW